MSRIGKKNVSIPQKVNASIVGNRILANGPKGELELELPPLTSAKISQGQIFVNRSDDTSKAKAMHGLARSLVKNLIDGVNHGFQKTLEIHGVGFKAINQSDSLVLSLGFSHSIIYKMPYGVKATVEDGTKIVVSGVDKQTVGKAAADIRAYYKPEPYKGKGVRYQGEKIIRKEGKTVQ